MQIKTAAYKNGLQRKVKSLPRVLLLFAAILGCAAGSAAAEAESPAILYANSGSNPFSAILEADGENELFATDENLVSLNIDAKPVSFEFSTDPQGKIKISGSLPGLPDGRHTATLATYSPDRQPVDSRQVLFLVDSAPPVIELVEPAGALPRTSTSLLFAVKDNEDGSGVVAEPEASELQVEITGADVFSKAFVLKDNALHVLVSVKFPESIVAPDYRFNVAISLKDRAGNEGQFSREFVTSGLIQPEFISLCKDNDTSILRALGFLVYPKEKGLQLQIGESRSLSFFAYGNYGKDYTYPPIRVNDHGKTAPEFTQLSKFFQREIGQRIEIISSSANISVQKQTDDDLTDNRITFDVTQTSAVPMGEQMGSIQVKVPVGFSLDKTIDYCPYDDYAKIPETAFTYTYGTVTIPIVRAVARQPVKMRILQEGDKLVSQVQLDSADLMDTAASWFEIDDEKYWYEARQDMCVAKGPVLEGTVHYRVAAVHALAVFQAAENGGGVGDRTLFNEGDFIVKRSPPVIGGFTYDRAANVLYADIADEGTPSGELDIKLGLPGYALDFDFDNTTGKLKAALSFTPLSVLNASLRVTDRAGQTTSATCTVFGNPDTRGNSVPGSTVSVHSETGAIQNKAGQDIVGSAGNGMHMVKVCSEASLQWGFYNKGKFITASPGSATLVRLYAKNTGLRSEAHQGNAGIEVFFNSYDTALYEPASQESAATQITMTGASTGGTGSRQKIYYATGYYKQGQFIPTNYNIGLRFTTKAVNACQIVKKDISSPIVQVTYDPESGLVSGQIHDSGMPLSQLNVSFIGRNDLNNGSPYRQSLPFSFEGGHFSGRFEPPPRGECFLLEVRAVDQAGNIGFTTIKVVIPRSPPDVTIQVETESSNQIFSSNASGINTHMTAEALDDSKILSAETTFWLDGQVLPRFNNLDTKPYQGRSSAFQQRAFHYHGIYAAQISEGAHVARFRAVDYTGLSAETIQPFEFSLAPVIRDLKVMPGAVLKAGGPVFTAWVIDRGGDLDVSGLSFTVNHEPLDAEKLFYDPASGYFAVEGPLDLPDGRHTIEITAVDSRGNEVKAALQFMRRLQVVSTPEPGAAADIAVDAISLMELRDHNGDGQANPGELLRLFIPLRNDAQYGLAQCRASLISGNEQIAVETGSVLYGQLDPGAVAVPLKGFDLQIGKEVLSGIVSDPYEIHFDLTVACGSGKEQHLPVVLPVYRPSVPVEISSAVDVVLDNLPPTTTLSAVSLRGAVTSTGAFLESVLARVNGLAVPVPFNRDGGRFEVTLSLEEGPNVIEVEAIDQVGTRGNASGYIHRAPAFVPPAIAITTPAENTFFQCGLLAVTGTYDPGSSTLDRIIVSAPLTGGGYGECTVTIVDESHFTANCGPVVMFGGVYDISARLETIQGVNAQTGRGIIVGDCF